MQTILLVIFALFAATACDDKVQYKNAAEFEAVIQSWQLDGKPVNEVISILANKNFICNEQYCNLNVGKIPCSQTQRIFLAVSKDGKVIKTTVWKFKDGELPSVCL